MKAMTIAMSALALSAVMSGMLADTAHAKKLNASRSQVIKACKDNGGRYYSNALSDQSYGCRTKGGHIHCDFAGECEGGRNDAARVIRKGSRR